jgi:hypothetical protein
LDPSTRRTFFELGFQSICHRSTEHPRENWRCQEIITDTDSFPVSERPLRTRYWKPRFMHSADVKQVNDHVAGVTRLYLLMEGKGVGLAE